ncbi:hypothetical protein [Actinoallomurus sp. CA-150999]|uniref:hypothetical protein n=1 Tax=Actinoallomurus sp. CA-150999 TaxID=3239887 RepID=UPI003D912FD2
MPDKGLVGGVVDPDRIQTRSDLHAALRSMFETFDGSYDDLVNGLGVGRNTAHDWVSGKSLPRWDSLKIVLPRFGIPASGLAAWRMAHSRAAAQPRRGRTGPGHPLADYTDPFALEVHPPFRVDAPTLPLLPEYQPRAHDAELSAAAAEAATGVSGMVVAVGESSSGKTRACWEALEVLRADGGWRLWRPMDAAEALAGLPKVEPRTVVWLNEAQLYLRDPAVGGQVAAELNRLLDDRLRGPVLVLGTLWPQHWKELTFRTVSGEHEQVRRVLERRTVSVPDAFTEAEVRVLAERASVDPRLHQAITGAADRRITQYLAGVPLLLERYRQLGVVSTALIHAAMDARRLGHGPALPLPFLADAAPGYLSDDDWSVVGGMWDVRLAEALADCEQRCNGIRGPLTRLTPRPGDAGGSPEGQVHLLADYLEQIGRTTRADLLPPAGFWVALARHGHPDDLRAVAAEADGRGLYRQAAVLDVQAVARGGSGRAENLLNRLALVDPAGFAEAAEWVATTVTLTRPRDIADLADGLWQHNAPPAGRAADLLARRVLGRLRERPELLRPFEKAVCRLLLALDELGGDTAELATHVADHAAQASLAGQLSLIWALSTTDECEQAAAAIGAVGMAAALRANPADVAVVAEVLDALSRAGAREAIEVVAARAVASADLTSVAVLEPLLTALLRAGAPEHTTVLLERAPACGPISKLTGDLLDLLHRWGDRDAVTALAARAAAETDPTDHDTAISMIKTLGVVGADDQATVLTKRVTAALDRTDPATVTALLEKLSYAQQDPAFLSRPGAEPRSHPSMTAAIYAVLALHPELSVDLTHPGPVAELLTMLHDAELDLAVRKLLSRDPAGHADLTDTTGVAALMDALVRVGADDQLAVLLAGDPGGRADPSDLEAAAVLRHALRRAGADSAAAVLEARAIQHVDATDTAFIAYHLCMDTPLAVAVDLLIAAHPGRHADLSSPAATAHLLAMLTGVGATEEVRSLLDRDPFAHLNVAGPSTTAEVLNALAAVGAAEQINAVLARDPAGKAAIEEPRPVCSLLQALNAAGATDAVAALLARDPAAHVTLTDARAIRDLLGLLDAAGARERADALAVRAANAGHFSLLIARDTRYRLDRVAEGRPPAGYFQSNEFSFGRTQDGQPTGRWTWRGLGRP